MKKTVNLLSVQVVLILCFLPSLISAQNLWTGSLVIGNWDNYQSLDASTFTSASVGDMIQITATGIDMSSAQLSLNNSSWADIGGAGMVDLRTETYSYVITSVMLAELQSGGVLVRGKNYTLTSIDLIPDEGKYVLENAVWLGETVIGDWSGYQPLSAGTFVNAQVGDLLRVKVKDLGANAQGHLSNNSWGDLIDAEAYVDLTGLTYYEFTITAAMLTELQANGLLIRGAFYTIEGVYVIDPLATGVGSAGKAAEYKYWVSSNQLNIEGLHTGSTVALYDVNGNAITKLKVANNRTHLPLNGRGVYMLEIQNGNARFVGKVMCK